MFKFWQVSNSTLRHYSGMLRFFKWDPVNCSDRQQLAENRESSITANELHSTSLNSRAMGGTKDTATSTL